MTDTIKEPQTKPECYTLLTTDKKGVAAEERQIEY
mgnify:CR=1 FL=1